MKMIAITQRVEKVEAYGETRDSLDQSWAKLVFQCGFLPVILPNNMEVAKSLLNQISISGIILTGGNNLVNYDGDAPERDQLEQYLIEYSMEAGIPLLGVCRGMQVIQDYFKVPLVKVKGHIATEHEINVEGKRNLKNSFHRYGARSSVEELLILAASEDGVVEAIYHKEFKIFAIMWHPERNNPFDQEDILYIENIFEEKKL